MRRAAAIFVLALLAVGAAQGQDNFRVRHLPAPPFPGPAADPGERQGVPRLELVSSQRNEITDVERWVARNRLRLREYAVPGFAAQVFGLPPLPAGLPLAFRGTRLVRAIRQPGRVLLVYGRDFSSGRYLVGADPATGELLYAFDFADWAYGPEVAPDERELVYQQPLWAAEADGVLYVSHAHSTYARSSGGRNAYVTAIDLATGKIRWRSPALVANADTFQLVAGVVVSGYGFTAEPDFLYLLDARTGRLLQRLPVASAPEYIFRKGNVLYVRTYDRDVVARLRLRATTS